MGGGSQTLAQVETEKALSVGRRAMGGSALIIAISVCVHRAAVIVMKSIVKNKGGGSEKGCPSKVETYYARKAENTLNTS